MARVEGVKTNDESLPLPVKRGLSKEQAADYLGIGVTLLAELRVPAVKIGRRCVYDKVDLDAWFEEHKQRGRAGKEKSLWPKKEAESIDARIPDSGGLKQPSQTASAYVAALKPKIATRPKRI